MKYTREQLDIAALQDLEVDARCAEQQAEEGPFYPDLDITRESLLAYAVKCRKEIERFACGGAHEHLLKPVRP